MHVLTMCRIKDFVFVIRTDVLIMTIADALCFRCNILFSRLIGPGDLRIDCKTGRVFTSFRWPLLDFLLV